MITSMQFLSCDRAFDIRRRSLSNGCARQIFLSFVFRGPVMHYWTTFLNRQFAHRKANLKTTVQKVLIHESVYDPFFTICFLFLLRITSGNGINVSMSGAKRDFQPALKSQYRVWPVIQLISYGFIPTKLQVLFLSTVAIFTNAYLTYLSKRK